MNSPNQGCIEIFNFLLKCYTSNTLGYIKLEMKIKSESKVNVSVTYLSAILSLIGSSLTSTS